MPRPLRTALCTVNRIIQRLNADSSSINVSTTAAQTTQINTESANFQAEMVDCIYKASDMITRAMNNVFVPYVHTQTWRGLSYRQSWQYDRRTGDCILRLPDSLLSVTSLTFTGTALASTDYYLAPQDSCPAREIALYSGGSYTLPSASTASIVLVGIWGYHPAPSAMWKVSGATVQSNPMTDSATTFTASSSTPLEVLQYIRVDSEYMLITAINTSTHVVTVERAVNGTTAAAHTQNTAIYTYEPVEDIADECARLAIRRYQLRSGMEFIPVGEGGLVEIKQGDVQLSTSYRRYYFGSA